MWPGKQGHLPQHGHFVSSTGDMGGLCQRDCRLKAMTDISGAITDLFVPPPDFSVWPCPTSQAWRFSLLSHMFYQLPRASSLSITCQADLSPCSLSHGDSSYLGFGSILANTFLPYCLPSPWSLPENFNLSLTPTAPLYCPFAHGAWKVRVVFPMQGRKSGRDPASYFGCVPRALGIVLLNTAAPALRADWRNWALLPLFQCLTRGLEQEAICFVAPWALPLQCELALLPTASTYISLAAGFLLSSKRPLWPQPSRLACLAHWLLTALNQGSLGACGYKIQLSCPPQVNSGSSTLALRIPQWAWAPGAHRDNLLDKALLMAAPSCLTSAFPY